MYDLTPYLKDGDNVLAVRVDHSRYADSRWYSGSGIYRDVYMVSAPESHLSQWGVGYTVSKLTDKKTLISVDYSVDNLKKGMSIEAVIYNKDGRKVASNKTLAKAAGKLTLNVDNPVRWDIENPYLYTMKVSLINNGKVVDKCETTVGLRSLEFTPDKGFALNGRSVMPVCLVRLYRERCGNAA
jgi:beta-galactosidase/beta-glucuronidase